MTSTLGMGWIALFISLAIAACAAYFSITGLSVLFAAALIPVIIMASVLEVGKLGATFFLHRYWNDLPRKLKYPLSVMIFILMLITSMGIFGFLSKGHNDQENPVIGLSIDIAEADERIDQHTDRIKTLDQQLALLNTSLQTLIEFKKISGPSGYLARQKELQPQIDGLQGGIESEKEAIRKIRTLKSSAERAVGNIEAKLGPVKDVAALFGYDLAADPDGKGKAVRIVIVLFMVAFDPFAIYLIMFSNWLFMKAREEKENVEHEELVELQSVINDHMAQDERIDADINSNIHLLAETYEKMINEKDAEIVSLTEMLQSSVEHVVFRDIEIPVNTNVEEHLEHIHDLEHALIVLETELEEKVMKLKEYMDIIDNLDTNLDAKPTEVEKIVEVENTERVDTLIEGMETATAEITDLEKQIEILQGEILGNKVETNDLKTENENLKADIESRDSAVQKLNEKYNLVEKIGIKADDEEKADTSVGFGIELPVNPTKGQMFLRVDTIPSKLYKYEGTRWIEATKDNTVEYDEQYLQHLINEIGDGKLELDKLSEKEQHGIENLLSKEDVLGK